MAILPLITIFIFFFAFTFAKSHLQKQLRFSICSICIAVSLTWILLLFLSFAGFVVNPLIIGILMGMSVTGVMNKMETAYKKNHLKHLWLARLITVIGGFYFILTLLLHKWNVAFVIFITVLILLGIISFLRQGITHADAIKDVAGTEKEKSLLKKLDNCC